MTPTRPSRLVVEGLGRLPQFSHAGVTAGLVFVSGTLGTTDGLTLAPGGAGPETAQALANIGRVLDASGVEWDDVAKVSVYLADMADFAAMNDAYGAFFPGMPPARITVGGVSLALGARVEIECVAGRPGPLPAGAGDRPRRETGFVAHEGEDIYFEAVGEGGPPLVLCHGAGGNHAVWYQQVSAFAAGRRVITWDHRGYGRSTDRAGRTGPEVATGDLLAVLDHLGVDRADLVGQSMGGWTAAGAALGRPGLVRSLVLADTLGGFSSPEIDAALAARTRPPGGDRIGDHPALHPGFSRSHPDRAHLYQSLGRMGTAEPDVVLGRLVAFTRPASDAARLAMPVLLVVGDEDPLFPPAAVRALAGLLPDARVVELPGCGHSPYFEDPATWNAVVARFLDAVPVRPGT